MEALNGCPCQHNIRSLRRRGPTKEHSQVEGIQACWELRTWIKTRPRIENAERLFSRFQIRSQWLSDWHESIVAPICRSRERRKKRKKEEVVASDLLVAILVVQRHNFAASWCGKWWDLLLTHTHTHTHTQKHTHTPNADESTYTITRTKFHPPSLLSRAALHYSWDWNLLSVCRLQTQKKKERKRILYTHSQVMTLHILRWMAITVHQCSAEFIPRMIEATEDTDACSQIFKEILHRI